MKRGEIEKTITSNIDIDKTYLRTQYTDTINYYLDNYCTPCGKTHQPSLVTSEKLHCADCPILRKLQENGKLLEEVQKNITFSKVDISSMTGDDFYYLRTIKEYTMQEIATAYDITMYQLGLLIDKKLR